MSGELDFITGLVSDGDWASDRETGWVMGMLPMIQYSGFGGRTRESGCRLSWSLGGRRRRPGMVKSGRILMYLMWDIIFDCT